MKSIKLFSIQPLTFFFKKKKKTSNFSLNSKILLDIDYFHVVKKITFITKIRFFDYVFILSYLLNNALVKICN